MKRLLVLTILFGLIVLLTPVFAADAKDKAKAKEALQALNDYIGSYKANGAPDKPRPDSKDTWNEKVDWSWRIKGDDRWIKLVIDKGKYYKGGDLRFLPDRDVYQLTMTTVDDKQEVFEGKLKDDFLILDYTDPEKKEMRRLKMNMAGEGARFIYCMERYPMGRKIPIKDFKVECSKEGESFAGGDKKNICVVTGGLGKIAVSYNGKTYYVCCTGCRDAFNENPAKIIKEFEESQKKK